MKLVTRAREASKKITLMTTAFILAVSTLTAAVPFILAQNASAVSSVVYQGIPSPSDAAYVSLGYEATSTNEFGDRIELAGSNRLLDDVTVNFTSWACETGGWSTGNCVTSANATFTHPVTVNVYNVGANGAVGSLIATKTQTITAKYRPSADPINCTGANAGKWFDAASSACFNGIAFDQTFDFATLNKVLPSQVIVGVAYNTSHRGYAPTGVAGPADSLNVSIPTAGPFVGSDVDSDVMYWNTSSAANGSASGVNTFGPDTNWSPYHLGVNISANAVPTVTACEATTDQWFTNLDAWNKSDTRSAGHNVVTGDGLRVYTDDASSNAKAAAYLPVNYPLAENGSQTIAQSIDWTGGTQPGLQLVVDFDNNGSSDGILVGEPVYGNSWWLSNSSATFVKNGAPNNGGGYGSAWYGTLNEWLASFPTAQVKAIGYSLGSGVHSDGVIKRLTFGCVNYKFDNQAPAAPVHVSPANNAVQSSNNFWFDWNDVAGAVRYEIQNSQNPAVDGNGSFQNVQWTGDYQHIQPTQSKAQSVGASGTWYWQVRAIDAAGNASAWTAPWKVTIDQSGPTVAIANPANGELFGGLEVHGLQKKTIAVQASASDTNGLGAYCVKFTKVGTSEGGCVSGGYVYAPANGNLATVNINTTTLASGEYVVKARVTDKANNATEVTRTVTVDNTKPVITTPLTDGQTLQGTVNVALNSTEAHPKIHNIRVLDGTGAAVAGLYDANATSANASFSWNTRDVADGTYKIQFSSRDAVGNSATTIFRTVIVDNDFEAPTVGLSSSTQNTATPTITGTVDDPTAIVKVMLEGVERDAVNNGDGTWSYLVPAALANGDYPVSVMAVDSWGNPSAPATGTLTIATVPTIPTDPSEGEEGGEGETPAVVVEEPTTTSTVTPDTPTIVSPVNNFAAILGTNTTGNDDTSNDDANQSGTPEVEGTSTEETLAAAANNTDGNAFGLAWYWWLLILAGGATGIWWLIAALRGRAAE